MSGQFLLEVLGQERSGECRLFVGSLLVKEFLSVFDGKVVSTSLLLSGEVELDIIDVIQHLVGYHVDLHFGVRLEFNGLHFAFGLSLRLLFFGRLLLLRRFLFLCVSLFSLWLFGTFGARGTHLGLLSLHVHHVVRDVQVLQSLFHFEHVLL